eukprot:gene3107-3557_t
MNMRLFFLLLLVGFRAFAQNVPDSVKRLKEVVIRPYFSTQPLLRATGSVAVLDSALLGKVPGTSLVPVLNSISGIRMEERSPGSYRLSIRGSLLRSPFGVRNIKIYIDEFPLTDAGGNTYLNALDLSSIAEIQVLKGPQSSIYGANSGGVVLISPLQMVNSPAQFKIQGGSYGLFQQSAAFGHQWTNNQLELSQGDQRSDGYRQHSAMQRKYFQVMDQYRYAAGARLKAFVFYSDLHYDTPGGLNALQYDQDPSQARPAAGPVKSAVEQQAGIYSKTLFGGLSNDWQISPDFKQVTAVFSSYTDFKNPFITNYEHRKEFTLGLRTYVEYSRKLQDLNWKLNLGLESTRTRSDVENFNNNYGSPAALQASDRLKALSSLAFLNLNLDFFKKWLLEISASGNLYGYHYQSIAPQASAEKTKNFDPQFMPRMALSYQSSPVLSFRASISRGYSPPTLAEIRASDNVINVNLQPESGWNYESGLRFETKNKRFFGELTGFYYHLQNAIVRRLNQNDTEYFLNAGGTGQWGLEAAFSAWLVPAKSYGLVRGLQLRTAWTLSRFKFKDYIDRKDNYSGNDLTGVPKNIISSTADLLLPGAWYLFVQHNYTSRIPLNDANSVYAAAYNLLQFKVGWKNLKIGSVRAEVFAGADNLLNQRYSLGNDLNAANGRYFNAAARRNFYAGLALGFNRH